LSECNDIGKSSAIVRIYTGGSWQNFGVDEVEVNRKLNYGWKTANIKTSGYSLPINKSEVCTISFANSVTTLDRFDGYVNNITETRNGKNLDYSYELYGREAFIQYRLYQPQTTVLNAGSFIADMAATIGYPVVIASTLYDTTITIDSARKDYVHNYLRELSDKHTINYYFDTGLTLHAFSVNDNTLSGSVNFAYERDKVSDVSNVYNRITLYTDQRRFNDVVEDLFTDTASDVTHWTYKRYKKQLSWSNKLYDDGARNADLSNTAVSTGTRSVHATGETVALDITVGLFSDSGYAVAYWETGAYLICDLGDWYDFRTISTIKYKVNVTNSNTLTYFPGPPYCSSTIMYGVDTDVLFTYEFPPTETPAGIAPHLTRKSGRWESNTGWHTISANVADMIRSSDPSFVYGRYIGVHIEVEKLLNDAITNGQPLEFDMYVDDLQINTNYQLTYSDSISTLNFGLREYKPDNAGYVIARTSLELQNKCVDIIGSKVVSEESLRKVSFPGSLNIEVGSAATITFDDTGTVVYDIKEVTDRQTNGEWIQELKVSHSPIYNPQLSFGDKLRWLDSKVRDINFNSINTSPMNIDKLYDYVDDTTSQYSNKDITYNFTCNTYTPQEVVDAIYKWNGNTWAPNGFTNITSALYFRDINTGNYIRQFPILIDHGSEMIDPAIVWDQAFVNKKDITCGGFLASNQGGLGLGHGLYYSIENPHVWLTHASLGWDCLDIKYWGAGAETVPATTLNGTIYDATTIGWGKEYYGKIRSGAFISSRDYPSQNKYLTFMHDGTNGSIICNFGNLVFSVPSGTIMGLTVASGSTFDTVTVNYGVTINNTAAWINFKDISVYRQTVPSTMLEISGSGLILDGVLNCTNISANSFGTNNGSVAATGISLTSYVYTNGLNAEYAGVATTLTVQQLLKANTIYPYSGDNVYFSTIIGTGASFSTYVYTNAISAEQIGVATSLNVAGRGTFGTITAGTYLNLPASSGVSISAVVIDADKNWNGKGISAIGTISGHAGSFDTSMYVNGLSAEYAGISTSLSVGGLFKANTITPYSGNAVNFDGKSISLVGTLTGQAASLSNWLYGNSVSVEYIGVATSVGVQGNVYTNKILPYSGTTVGFDTITATYSNLTELRIVSGAGVSTLTGGSTGTTLYLYNQKTIGLGTSAYPFKYVDSQYIFTDSMNPRTNGTIRITGTIYPDGYYNLPAASTVTLSNVGINTDKDWGAYNITNLGTLQLKYIYNVGASGLTVGAHLVPLTDANYDNGLSGNKWRRLYATTVITGNVWANTILYSDGNSGTVSIPGRATVGTLYANTYQNLPTGGSFSGNLSDLSINADKAWSSYNITGVGTLTAKVLSNVGTNLTISAHVAPSADATYDNGLAGAKWNRVYSATMVTGKVWANTILQSDGTNGTVAIPGRATIGTLYVGTYGNLPAAGGVSISAVTIDDDKDWNGKGISNIGTISIKAGSRLITNSNADNQPQRYLVGSSGGYWAEYLYNTTSGGNSGDDYYLLRYSDNGTAYLGAGFTVRRSDGKFSSANNVLDDGSGKATIVNSLYSTGANAGLWFANRNDNATLYAWYANAGNAYLWSSASAGNALTCDYLGNFNVGASLSVTGGAGINGDVLIAHSNTVYLNVHSTNNSKAILNIMSNSDDKIAIGWDTTNGFVEAYHGNLAINASEAGKYVDISAAGGYVFIHGGITISPSDSGGSGYCGNSTRYWYDIYCYQLHLDTQAYTFDVYDDLAIAKLWGEPNQVIDDEKYDKGKIQPPKNDPFSILRKAKVKTANHDNTITTEEDNGFFDISRWNSFLMGCVKKLATERDEQKTINLELLSKLEELDNKVKEINSKIK
jgi:hypothetical protein